MNKTVTDFINAVGNLHYLFDHLDKQKVFKEIKSRVCLLYTENLEVSDLIIQACFVNVLQE